MSASLLIVEDEEKLARFIELELLHEGYQVKVCTDGRDALLEATEHPYDLILLDIMLPGLNGLEVLRRLMRERPTPVILLTARDAVMDKVAGLDAGAVDYITKPFAIEELLARIRVALKLHPANVGRSASDENSDSEEGILRWGPLTLDEPKRRVTVSGHEVSLTNREFLMLKVLLENTDIVLSRETLLENRDIVLSRDVLLSKVCGYDYVGETNVIDVYIRYLRSKIDDVFGFRMIRTVRGVGYVIQAWTDS